jgi:hypothetical protein
LRHAERKLPDSSIPISQEWLLVQRPIFKSVSFADARHTERDIKSLQAGLGCGCFPVEFRPKQSGCLLAPGGSKRAALPVNGGDLGQRGVVCINRKSCSLPAQTLGLANRVRIILPGMSFWSRMSVAAACRPRNFCMAFLSAVVSFSRISGANGKPQCSETRKKVAGWTSPVLGHGVWTSDSAGFGGSVDGLFMVLIIG